MTKQISHEQWALLVELLTGRPYSAVVDLRYRLHPVNKTLPRWFLRTRPYEVGTNDCDDRSKYGYCEIHDRRPGVPIVLARGTWRGERHEFLIVGCLGEDGTPGARYCHRLTDGFEWIDPSDITEVNELW